MYLQLAPLLLSTFLEAAPTAFAPSATVNTTLDTPIALCLTTASLTLTLARPILRSTPRADVRNAVSDFLRRMAPYFPFRAQSGPSPTGLTPALELNLVYSNLAILLAPPVPPLTLRNGRKEAGWRERVKAVEEAWKGMREGQAGSRGKKKSDGWAMGEVAEWVIEALVRDNPPGFRLKSVSNPHRLPQKTPWPRYSPRRHTPRSFPLSGPFLSSHSRARRQGTTRRQSLARRFSPISFDKVRPRTHGLSAIDSRSTCCKCTNNVIRPYHSSLSRSRLSVA